MEKMTVEDANGIVRLVDSERITEWMRPTQSCGETSFDEVKTNIGWCEAEARRISAKKGHKATVVNAKVTHEKVCIHMVAVVVVPDGMNAEDVRAAYLMAAL